MKTLLLLLIVIISLPALGDVCESNDFCVNPNMPIWSQSSSDLKDYINEQEGLDVGWDPGWCGMVSAAMFLRGIGLDRDSNTRMTGIWNEDSSTTRADEDYILEAGKLVKTDLEEGGTNSRRAKWGFKKIRNSWHTYLDKKAWKRSKRKGNFDSEVWQNIDVSVAEFKKRIKEHRPASYIGVGVYGRDEKDLSKRTCKWKWEKWKLKRTCTTTYYKRYYYTRNGGHALVINGYEGEYFKIFDPWGRIYNAELTNEKHDYTSSRIKKKIRFSYIPEEALPGFAYTYKYFDLFLDSYISWSLKKK